MPVQRISFQTLPVDDQDRAMAFYRDRLGLTVQVDAPYQEGWRWIFMAIPGTDDRIQFGRRSELSVADGMPVLALVSDDVDADCTRWAADGVTVKAGPDDAPWAQGVRWALIADSEGNTIFVESVKPDG